jgi:hypothetical protein
LFSAAPEASDDRDIPETEPRSLPVRSELGTLDDLEKKVDDLHQELEDLKAQFEEFKRQFE